MPTSKHNFYRVMSSALDKLPLNGVHDGFEAVVGPQLLIDVMEMITQRLRADGECAFDLVALFTLCKHPQNVYFLLG